MTKPTVFAWTELHTKDRARAEAFYQTLFGWTSTPVEMGPDYTYHLLNRADTGQMFAGSHQQGPDEADQPSFWLISLGMDDVDAATARATELGATVIMEPMDIPGTGRFSLIVDPQGAAVSLLAYSDGGDAPEDGEGPGCIVWRQLITSDPAASGAFYSSLLGFDYRDSQMGDWTANVFAHGEDMFADIQPKASPEMPDAWVFYVEVQDAQATADLAVASGGTVVTPPFPLPPVGVLAWLADPTGALFGIMQPLDPAGQ